MQTRRSSLVNLQRWRCQPRWGWVVGWVLCLLLGQGLGVWHRIQHVPAVSASGVPSAALADSASVTTGSDFWSHAAGQVDCQLWDHLLLGDQHAPPALADLTAAPPVWGLVATGAPCRTVQVAWLPPARGPPNRA